MENSNNNNAHSAIDMIMALFSPFTKEYQEAEDKILREKASKNLKDAYTFKQRVNQGDLRGKGIDWADNRYDKALYYAQAVAPDGRVKRGYEMDYGFGGLRSLLELLGLANKPRSKPEFEGKVLQDLLQNYESMR